MLKHKFTKLALTIAFAGNLTLAAFTSMSAMASAPMAKTSAPGYFRVMLGAYEITALSDGTVDLPVDKLLAQPAAKTNAALAKSFLSSPLETSVNAYLVNTGSKLILIDTGTSGLFGPSLGKLINNLKSSGYEPAQIDEIYLTHMHPDHVGGLAADGKALFSNAIVRADQRDSDYWLSEANMNAAPAESKGFFQGAMASLKPYIAANKYIPFNGNTELSSGIKSFPSYGHTIGHTSYVVESEGKKLMLLGDLIHVNAVQLFHPEITISFDSDAKEATVARDVFFKQAVKEGALVGASHIQFPGLGHLLASGKTYQWLPVNYTQMH